MSNEGWFCQHLDWFCPAPNAPGVGAPEISGDGLLLTIALMVGVLLVLNGSRQLAVRRGSRHAMEAADGSGDAERDEGKPGPSGA